MNRRIILLVVIVLLVGMAFSSRWLAQAADQPVTPAYRLELVAARTMVVSSGGDYRLLLPESPSGTGTPCCCAYLPCVRK